MKFNIAGILPTTVKGRMTFYICATVLASVFMISVATSGYMGELLGWLLSGDKNL